jgi:hypothetical protein
MDKYYEALKNSKIAYKEANKILSYYSNSYKSRVIDLKELSSQLKELPIDIRSYFNEAISCLESDHKRASLIMAWAGFFYIFSRSLYNKHELDIHSNRQKWKFNSFEEFRENNSESQILDVAKEVKFINKADLRVYQGHLSTRNKCAHPTLYQPNLNFSIGYVNEMMALTIGYIDG